MQNISQIDWSGLRVLVTGDTGFTGSWLSRSVLARGATVGGFSLPPSADSYREIVPNGFSRLTRQAKNENSAFGDIRNLEELETYAKTFDPDVVVHLAADAQVLEGYRSPFKTFSVNAVGTLNVLEVVRKLPRARVTLIVTTDKVYRQFSNVRKAFVESDSLWGSDPYSASKVCAEQVVASYRESFFSATNQRVFVARAGNIVGGGDWSRDRLLPDLMRSLLSGVPCSIRMPKSVRPWGHVGDVVGGYLRAIDAFLQDGEPFESINFGPSPGEVVTVEEFVAIVRGVIPEIPAPIFGAESPAHKEELHLALDATESERLLSYSYKLSPTEAIELASQWYLGALNGADVATLLDADLRKVSQ